MSGYANVPLPPGWEARRDRTGRLYYVDHRTKATSWVDPRPLPPGWDMKYDARTRRKYFVCHQTRSTQWNDPRPVPLIGVPTPIQVHSTQIQKQDKRDFGNADRGWYKDVLEICLLDEAITPDADSLLAQVRQKLKIDEKEHEKILNEMNLTLEDLKSKRKDAAGAKECIVCLDERLTRKSTNRRASHLGHSRLHAPMSVWGLCQGFGSPARGPQVVSQLS
eukprot:CAMPEP_0175098390 /NCGR_PEP_ID=MMETSP0086_2-20121207/5840_1 /TAXON_ID=136419 /ORGANISM="Unknown Unknown, Strain D1" /LENGTH=220 /DNA_ID=CAMNT_0016372055 /DNA_START=49 /DNA_END=711 /DNA_ORIENTATION=-